MIFILSFSETIIGTTTIKYVLEIETQGNTNVSQFIVSNVQQGTLRWFNLNTTALTIHSHLQQHVDTYVHSKRKGETITMMGSAMDTSKIYESEDIIEIVITFKENEHMETTLLTLLNGLDSGGMKAEKMKEDYSNAILSSEDFKDEYKTTSVKMVHVPIVSVVSKTKNEIVQEIIRSKQHESVVETVGNDALHTMSSKELEKKAQGKKKKKIDNQKKNVSILK